MQDGGRGGRGVEEVGGCTRLCVCVVGRRVCTYARSAQQLLVCALAPAEGLLGLCLLYVFSQLSVTPLGGGQSP